MATSQNGWGASASASNFVPFRWITGRIRPGSVAVVFDHLCERFHAEVEPINPAHSWGWNFRAIRGASRLSNHASGTAIDLNAPAHPLGAVDTFTKAQVKAIRSILADLDGVVRWGGDYSGRKDEMHFEIVGSVAQVDRVAVRLLNPTPTPKPTPTPTPEDDDMVIIRHPKGPAVAVSGGTLMGIKSAETLANFERAGIPVVAVDDATWQDFHRVAQGR